MKQTIKQSYFVEETIKLIELIEFGTDEQKKKAKQKLFEMVTFMQYIINQQ